MALCTSEMFTPAHAPERGPLHYDLALRVEIALSEYPTLIDKDGKVHVIIGVDEYLSRLARKLYGYGIFAKQPEAATDQALMRIQDGQRYW